MNGMNTLNIWVSLTMQLRKSNMSKLFLTVSLLICSSLVISCSGPSTPASEKVIKDGLLTDVGFQVYKEVGGTRGFLDKNSNNKVKLGRIAQKYDIPVRDLAKITGKGLRYDIEFREVIPGYKEGDMLKMSLDEFKHASDIFFQN